METLTRAWGKVFSEGACAENGDAGTGCGRAENPL